MPRLARHRAPSIGPVTLFARFPSLPLCSSRSLLRSTLLLALLLPLLLLPLEPPSRRTLEPTCRLSRLFFFRSRSRRSLSHRSLRLRLSRVSLPAFSSRNLGVMPTRGTLCICSLCVPRRMIDVLSPPQPAKRSLVARPRPSTRTRPPSTSGPSPARSSPPVSSAPSSPPPARPSVRLA